MASSVTVGNVEIIPVLDMIPPSREPTMMFPDTSADDWAGHQDALENGQLQLYYGCWVVRSQGITILVDTGMGPGPHADRGNVEGELFERLRDVLIPADRRNNTNVGPSDEVNIVVHTHLHGDHVGWNLRYSGGNARPLLPPRPVPGAQGRLGPLHPTRRPSHRAPCGTSSGAAAPVAQDGPGGGGIQHHR